MVPQKPSVISLKSSPLLFCNINIYIKYSEEQTAYYREVSAAAAGNHTPIQRDVEDAGRAERILWDWSLKSSIRSG